MRPSVGCILGSTGLRGCRRLRWGVCLTPCGGGRVVVQDITRRLHRCLTPIRRRPRMVARLRVARAPLPCRAAASSWRYARPAIARTRVHGAAVVLELDVLE